jgi:hypothetical protein
MDKNIENQQHLALDYLNGLLGTELLPTDVHKNKDIYNNRYNDIAELYGFSDFCSMFDYCMNDAYAFDFIKKATDINNNISSSASSSKSKEKDTSDLVLDTKTTIRNGKPYTSRYWVDPNNIKDNKLDKEKGSSNKTVIADGLYMGGQYFGLPTDSLKKLGKPPKSWVTLGMYKSKCFDYVYIINDNKLIFIVGLALINGLVGIQYISALSKKTIIGNTHKLLSKIVKECWLNGYGTIFNTDMFSDYVNIMPFCKLYQFNKRGNDYYCSAKHLLDMLGTNTCYK